MKQRTFREESDVVLAMDALISDSQEGCTFRYEGMIDGNRLAATMDRIAASPIRQAQ